MKLNGFEGRKNISGKRIHQAREALCLSQRDLAAQRRIRGVWMEQEAISRIEMGDRFITDYELMIFAKILGVSVKWLIGRER